MLTPEQKQTLRDQLVAKYQAAQDPTMVEAAKDNANKTNTVADIGSVFSDLATADSRSRGGQGSDKSMYEGMKGQASQAIKDAVEARQGKIQNVLGEMNMNKDFNNEDRQDQAAQLAQDQFSEQKNQTGIQNAFTNSKMAQDQGQFDTRLGFDKERLAQENQLKQAELLSKNLEMSKKNNEQTRKESLDLSQQYMNHPTTKNTNVVLNNYDKIQSLAKDSGAMKTGAGDLGLVFSYMKMLDPGSTVREGEFSNAQNSGGVDEKLRNLYNAISKGQILSPTQRLDFVKAADNLKSSQIKSQKDVFDQYTGLANRYSLDPKQAFGDAPSMPQESKIDPQDQAAMDWAKANQNDPRAVKIIEKLKSKGL